MSNFPGNVNSLSHSEAAASHLDPKKTAPKPGAEYPKSVGDTIVNNKADEVKARAQQQAATAKSDAKAEAELKKLKTFLMENFKNETGDETPVDCAIRLLKKK